MDDITLPLSSDPNTAPTEPAGLWSAPATQVAGYPDPEPAPVAATPAWDPAVLQPQPAAAVETAPLSSLPPLPDQSVSDQLPDQMTPDQLTAQPLPAPEPGLWTQPATEPSAPVQPTMAEPVAMYTPEAPAHQPLVSLAHPTTDEPTPLDPMAAGDSVQYDSTGTVEMAAAPESTASVDAPVVDPVMADSATLTDQAAITNLNPEQNAAETAKPASKGMPQWLPLVGLMVLFIIMFAVVGLVGYYLGWHQGQAQASTVTGAVQVVEP